MLNANGTYTLVYCQHQLHDARRTRRIYEKKMHVFVAFFGSPFLCAITRYWSFTINDINMLAPGLRTPSWRSLTYNVTLLCMHLNIDIRHDICNTWFTESMDHIVVSLCYVFSSQTRIQYFYVYRQQKYSSKLFTV